MAPSPDLIPSRVAAERVGLSLSTFLRWASEGIRITPAYRFPGERGAQMFDPAAVEALRDELKAEALARFDTDVAS